jgi:hypothetical protein
MKEDITLNELLTIFVSYIVKKPLTILCDESGLDTVTFRKNV